MNKPSPQQVESFQQKILDHYQRHRRQFPWRQTRDPYAILVSEVMLQQTQTDRVAPKYEAFLESFPTVDALAAAPLGEVLGAWSGLGYNRRAKMLHQAAKKMVSEYRGRVPETAEGLETLPGIGPYTAAAVAAFAHNQATVVVETNIRTVYLHEFFPDRERVADGELVPLIEATLYRTNPRRWYNALMDYGAMLKETHPNPSRRSAHHSRQSRFEGSDRQIRGAILRFLLENAGTKKKTLTKRMLEGGIGDDEDRIKRIVEDLRREGFVAVGKDGNVSLSD